MNVEDMVYSMTEKKTISGNHVHVSPSSAETLVRRGGITNDHLIAYSLSNISAKNYQNLLMCVEVIVCNISVIFETQCRLYTIIIINCHHKLIVYKITAYFFLEPPISRQAMAFLISELPKIDGATLRAMVS